MISIFPSFDLRSLLHIYYRVFAIAAFVCGLIFKPPVLRHVTRLAWLRAAFAGVAMTVAWWILDGVILVGACAVCILTLNPAVGLRESSAQWLGVLIVAPMIRAGLETFAVRRIFSRTATGKDYWLLCLANAICLAAAIYTFIFYATAYPTEA